MLKRLHKVLLTMLALSLMACSNLSLTNGGVASPVTIARLQTAELQILGDRSLVSYDVYADGDVLHALFAVASDIPKRPYIAYMRSEDNGRHWSKPIEIGHYVSRAVESSAGNEIQIAASGDTILAIWQVTGEIPGMGPLQAVYSLDGGVSWSQGENPTGSETDQSHPDLVADTSSRFHLVWLDDRDENGYQGLRYARTSDAGQNWELAQTIDDSTCSCCWNRLLIGQNNQVNVLYRDMEPRDMALAQSYDAGQSWKRSSTVGEFNWVFDGCPHNGGALAWAGQTLQALAWTGADDKAGLYYLNATDDGSHWSPPQRMGGESLAFHSDIAAIDAKHVLAIWDARGADGSSVMMSESLDSGKHWSTPRQISTHGHSAQFPRLVFTAKGGLAMWVEQKPDGVKQWMSAILQ